MSFLIEGSPGSEIILDDVNSIIDYSSIGPRFSNRMLQALLVLLKTLPPHNLKIAIFVTTHKSDAMEMIGFENSIFNQRITLPNITQLADLKQIALEITKQEIEFDPGEEASAAEMLSSSKFTIKQITDIINIVFISKNHTREWKDISWKSLKYVKFF
jgi:vesicle-fusing ATPase